jgi:LmbE family N-acetylglucosaminyl deacetylase
VEGNVLSRRRVLTGLGVLGIAAAIPASCAAHSGRRTQRVLGAGGAPSILQIVAHQDDDVLFMNPDLSAALAAGIPTTTVYLTAGEAMGAFDYSRTREQFAADRQDAARAAYGQMLGSDAAWNRQAVPLPGGRRAELSTLPGVDHLKLLFLNLPDGDDRAAVPDRPGLPQGMALSGLLLGQRPDIPTIVPSTGPVTEAYHHTKDSLLAALSGFLDEYQPTILRTQDPMYAEQRWRGTKDFGADHPDHIATARWADLALQRHLAGESSARMFVVNYAGYGTNALAANLAAAQSAAKDATFGTYTAHDVNARHFTASYPPYQHRRYHRWTPGSLRALPSGAGVAVFGVANQQVVQWICTEVTGVWSGPFPLGGTAVRALDAVPQADGRTRLFALQVDAMAGVSGIVTCVQDSPGGAFGPWSEPQNPVPNPGAAASAAMLHGDALGQPAAVTAPNGTVHLFVRAADATVYQRILTDGNRNWKPWVQLTGRFVLDGLCPLIGADGRVTLHAAAMAEPADATQPAVTRLLRWTQSSDDGPLTPDLWFPDVETAGAPVAVLDQDGAPRVLYQLPDTADTGMITRGADGTWSPIQRLSPTGGSGPVVAAAAPGVAGGRLHVAVGTPGSGLGIFQQRTDATDASDATDATFPALWQDLGGCWPGPPALAADRSGRLVVAALGLDGRLAVAGQPRPGAEVGYSQFRSVGD